MLPRWSLVSQSIASSWKSVEIRGTVWHYVWHMFDMHQIRGSVAEIFPGGVALTFGFARTYSCEPARSPLLWYLWRLARTPSKWIYLNLFESIYFIYFWNISTISMVKEQNPMPFMKNIPKNEHNSLCKLRCWFTMLEGIWCSPISSHLTVEFTHKKRVLVRVSLRTETFESRLQLWRASSKEITEIGQRHAETCTQRHLAFVRLHLTRLFGEPVDLHFCSIFPVGMLHIGSHW